MPSLNRREACAMLNVTFSRFKQLLDEGVLPPGFGPGPRSLRWDRDELIAALRQRPPKMPHADAA